MGAGFASGYLIVNIRLSRFGVYAPGLLRADYVLAGLLFVCIVGVGFAFTTWAFRDAPDVQKHWRNGAKHIAVLTVLSSLIFALLPQWLIIASLSDLTWRETGWTLFSLAGIVATLQVVQLQRPWFRHGELPDYVRFERRYVLLAIALNAFFCLSIYAHDVYPKIPSVYGGGQKSPVMLVVTPEGAQVAMQLGLRVSTNNQLVGPLQPLMETDQEIVVLTEPGQGYHPKANAVRIPKRLCQAIVGTTGK